MIKWIGWPVSLFPYPSLSSLNELMNKVPRWQGWRFCMGSTTWTSTYWVQPEYSIVECPSACTRDQYWLSNMASFFKLINQLPGGRFICYTESLLLWRGRGLVLTGINIYSVCIFTFHILSASAQITICGLTEYIH